MNAGTRQGSRALELTVEPSGKVRVESDKLQSTKYAQEEYAVEGQGLGLGWTQAVRQGSGREKSHQKATAKHTFQKSAN
jgi:hypothetical protein